MPHIVATETPRPSIESVALDAIASRTRNILLYGPPGTGKTFTVRQFAEHFLGKQLSSPASIEQHRLEILHELKWYEAIALAMVDKSKSLFKVKELAETEISNGYSRIKRSQRMPNAIWAQLQIHTSPESTMVKYSDRHEPFLFEKNSESEWRLTEAGQEYVQVNLTAALEELNKPKGHTRPLTDFNMFVTFHQSFAYEEFIEGLKPVTDEDDGQIRYEVKGGVFKQISERASLDPDSKYLLIIDEINRANISKVFGELITLIEDDKRLGQTNELKVRLPYSQQEFGVPSNLYILGTMNTADRSIALLDIALRRRFTFVEIMPQPELVPEELDCGALGKVPLRKVFERLNERIAALLDRDHQIGHSYFMNVTDLDGLRFVWHHKVIPLLQEYFYNDGETLRAVLGKAFVEENKPHAKLFDAAPESFDADTARFEIRKFENDDAAFAVALCALASAALTTQVDTP